MEGRSSMEGGLIKIVIGQSHLAPRTVLPDRTKSSLATGHRLAGRYSLGTVIELRDEQLHWQTLDGAKRGDINL